MDSLEPIAPHPQLSSVDRAAPTRRVRREQEQAPDQGQERRRHRDDEADPDSTDAPDDGRPHVDISV